MKKHYNQGKEIVFFFTYLAGWVDMVALRALAERCGMSVAAVSKALNGRQGISAEKADLVRRTAREMGYYPNAAALTLKAHRSLSIGILYKNVVANEYFSAILDGIRDSTEGRLFPCLSGQKHPSAG